MSLENVETNGELIFYGVAVPTLTFLRPSEILQSDLCHDVSTVAIN
jgi:hypothetical protein